MASKIAEAFVTLRPSLDGFEAEARRGFSRINLTQKVKVEADTSQAQKQIGGLGAALSGAGGIATGILGAEAFREGLHFINESIQAAAEDEAAQLRLRNAVENTGAAWSTYSKQLDDVAQRGIELGFSDEQTREALALLTAQTDSAGEAQRRFALAQDLSRGTGLDLITASRLLGKVTEENVNVLARYGIRVKEGATETDLFAAVYAKFHGQAQTFADSTAGQMARLKAETEEAKEEFGREFTPLYVQGLKIITIGVKEASRSMGGWTDAIHFTKQGVNLLTDAVGLTDTKTKDYQTRLRELGEREAPDVAQAVGIVSRSFEAQALGTESLRGKLVELAGEQVKTNGATQGTAEKMTDANKAAAAFNENLDKQIAAIKGNGAAQDAQRFKLDLQKQKIDDTTQAIQNNRQQTNISKEANTDWATELPKTGKALDGQIQALQNQNKALGLSRGGTEADTKARDAQSNAIQRQTFNLDLVKQRLTAQDEAVARNAQIRDLIETNRTRHANAATDQELFNLSRQEQGIAKVERAIANTERQRSIQAANLDAATRKTAPYTQAQIDAAKAAEEVALKQAGWNSAMDTESRLLQDVLTHLDPVVRSSKDWLEVAKNMDTAASNFNKELSGTSSALDKWKDLPTPELLALKAAQSDVNKRISDYQLELDKAGKKDDAHMAKLREEQRVIGNQITAFQNSRQATIDLEKVQQAAQQQIDGVTRSNWLWLASLDAAAKRMPADIAAIESANEIIRNRQRQALNPNEPLFGAAPPRDMGGIAEKGHPYMIGAGVREIFVPNENGTIIPLSPAAGAQATIGVPGAQAPQLHFHGGITVQNIGKRQDAKAALGALGYGIKMHLLARGIW